MCSLLSCTSGLLLYVPLHSVYVRVTTRCTIPLCTFPICTTPVWTIPICATPLYGTPICTTSTCATPTHATPTCIPLPHVPLPHMPLPDVPLSYVPPPYIQPLYVQYCVCVIWWMSAFITMLIWFPAMRMYNIIRTWSHAIIGVVKQWFQHVNHAQCEYHVHSLILSSPVVDNKLWNTNIEYSVNSNFT